MIEKYRHWLYELGLSEIQIQIYNYILTHQYGTVNKIKNELNYSYSQVHYNLSNLEEIGLIFSSKGEKNKRYYNIDPKIALTRLLEKKLESFKERISKLDEDIKIHKSVKGKCIKTVSFYHYNDVNLALENLYRLIINAKNEIYISSLPPSILSKLEPALYNAFLKGVNIYLYFSLRDFENISNYFEIITDILNRISLYVFEVNERTCQNVRYNDIIVNSGFILIDDSYLNSVVFIDDDVFHFDGFQAPKIVQSSKKMLQIKTIKKKIKIDYPNNIDNVLKIISEKESIKTSELSKISKISGSKLKEILDHLIREGKIKETISNEGAGRPAVYYSLNI
ncbi:MAG: winged helix DNA-binding protein [Candidatus Lokiarchaeota archaeon]|nr:winged helix DNA-binding protein [Candidatus Lokiarchaeota archaeon]